MTVMDIARRNNLKRIMRCCTIMGRKVFIAAIFTCIYGFLSS